MSTTKQRRGGVESVLEQFVDPHLGSREVTGDTRRHTDADAIRRHYGFPEFDPGAYKWGIIDDVLVHEWDAAEDRVAGGTDLFAIGQPGSGKSTLAAYLSERVREINDETVTWRGSPSRSEWLALAPWATLWLPRGELEITLRPKDPRQSPVTVDVDELDGEIVRSVRRYSSTRDLLESIGEGSGINVVYPDPEMRGCQAALERSARQVEPPSDRDELFHPSDPTKHWWFGWFLDRVDQGPHVWTTWVCDEIGDLAPQNCRKDDYGTFQKVELLKDSWVDARKHGLSIFAFGHSEADVHSLIRRKMRWRVAMPGGANPTTASGVVGFESVPMHTDMTSSFPAGKALAFNESHFQPFRWADTSVDHSWTVQIRPLGGS